MEKYYVDKLNAGMLDNRSINLGNPGATWWTPAESEDGQACQKPSWQAGNSELIKNYDNLYVAIDEEVKRLRIHTRVGGNGFMIKLTDSSSKRLTNWLNKLGKQYGSENISYHFEYDEAVIMRKTSEVRLDEYMAERAGKE